MRKKRGISERFIIITIIIIIIIIITSIIIIILLLLAFGYSRKAPFTFRHVRLSAYISTPPTGQFLHVIWYWGLLWKYVEKVKCYYKIGRNTGDFTWRLKYVLVLFAALNIHKIAVDWNGIRLLVHVFTCQSVCPHVSSRLPLGGFPWNLIFWDFPENLWRNSKFG